MLAAVTMGVASNRLRMYTMLATHTNLFLPKAKGRKFNDSDRARKHIKQKTGNECSVERGIASAHLCLISHPSSVQVVQRKRDSRTHSEVRAGDSVTLSRGFSAIPY